MTGTEIDSRLMLDLLESFLENLGLEVRKESYEVYGIWSHNLWKMVDGIFCPMIMEERQRGQGGEEGKKEGRRERDKEVG